MATVLASLDSSFVPIAFPDLIDDLDTSTGTVVWVALGYLLAATGPMLFLARIGDRIGYEPLFRSGTAIYSLGMLGCVFAPTVHWLIGIRVIQGFGMAVFLPATFSLATQVYPPSERGKALGILASANSAGFILGPVFAGWLLDAYDWRAIFSSRAPLALLTVALALLALPKRQTKPSRSSAALDWKGAIYLSGSLFGLLYGLNRLPVEDNHLNPIVWLVFGAGIFTLWFFIRHERRVESPLIDVELYKRSPGFAKASIAFFAMFASFPVYLFILPLLLIGGLEFRAWDAGMLLAVVALITFIVSPWAGKISDRLGAGLPSSIGAALELAGYLALFWIGVNATTMTVLLPMVLFGFGSGLFFSPNNRQMMSSVPPEQAGMASGMIGTVRQAGYALGFAVTASLFTFIQNRFEFVWTRRSLEQLSEADAHQLTEIFEEGGIWSPEVLVYILHVGAILSAALLVVATLYSLPNLVFSGRRHLAAIGGAGLSGAICIGLFVTLMDIRMQEEGEIVRGIPAARPAYAVMPYGMASRGQRDVPAFAPPVLLSGREVFVFYCSDCHALDGKGVSGRGVDLTRSTFLQRLKDAELVAYLREGRQVDDPRNRTGGAMPGMKTMPTFSPENYNQVVNYLRSLSGTGT
jgi:DHA2 family multidrug resistance protein-like MFS transporter